MENLKLLHRGHDEMDEFDGMISGRQAMVYLNLSDHVFFEAVRSRVLQPQREVARFHNTQYAFLVAYLDEIKRVLPEERGKGMTVFTSAIKEKITTINKQWENKILDFNKDNADTIRVLKEIEKKKRKR